MTIEEQIEKLAEEVYEYIANNTPDDKGKLPWPHNNFSTLRDGAKEHYRHAARWHLKSIGVNWAHNPTDALKAELVGLRHLLSITPEDPMATPLLKGKIAELEQELATPPTKPPRV